MGRIKKGFVKEIKQVKEVEEKQEKLKSKYQVVEDVIVVEKIIPLNLPLVFCLL